MSLNSDSEGRWFESSRAYHDKLTGYTKGVVCQLLYNHIKPLRRSDSTAAFLFLKGSLK